MNPSKKNTSLSRRDFLKSSAFAGIGTALSPRIVKGDQPELTPSTQKSPSPLNIAVIGTGTQGRVLIESCLRIPEIHFKAICDIWGYSQRYASRYLQKYGYNVNVYEDFRQLLDKEKELHAVIIATPDWMHAEQANACMERGLHVYCEKEMSNSLEQARSMVRTAKKTKKLLQIGHQRRSNPRYIHAIELLIHEKNLLGQVGQSYAQWNRAKSEMLGWPEKYTIPPEKLEKYGYGSMIEFRNWRWFKKYGGGPMVDLGSHQIDLFPWVFGCLPSSVTSCGGNDYYDKREWYDNVMAIYEFKTPQGTCRAMYQVQTTTKYGGFFEAFMGDNGTIVMSEVPQNGNWAMREAHAPEWDSLVKDGFLESETPPVQKLDTQNIFLDVRVTQEAGRWPLPVELAKPPHQPHLENFFSAIRDGTPLNCPGEIGFETAVAVLTANKAVESTRKINFDKGQFKA
ncbi:MAG: gfo/Idh/MocA family oxidoreductase [Candidatus Aminicenantes bacterium]|nr:gfo/Idh/MocA family oxidoreductase [Candidatus Aminicenantes bacterium]